MNHTTAPLADVEADHIDFVEWRELPLPYMPKWWDRPRWWLVRLLGGSCPFDTVKVIRVPVNGKDFMERLWKQKRALVENFRREPTTHLDGRRAIRGVDAQPHRERNVSRTRFVQLRRA